MSVFFLTQQAVDAISPIVSTGNEVKLQGKGTDFSEDPFS